MQFRMGREAKQDELNQDVSVREKLKWRQKECRIQVKEVCRQVIDSESDGQGHWRSDERTSFSFSLDHKLGGIQLHFC